LPWKTIEVYFASPELGALYEHSKFEANLRQARLDIAACLTSPTYSLMLRAFEGVEFRQAKRPFDHSGSMFGSVFGDANLEIDFTSIYVVHSRLYATELKDGITTCLRITPARATSNLHVARMRHYINAYRSLRTDSRSLGKFRHTIWDDSSLQWSEFATQSRILDISMEHLVGVADLRRDETVLELGAGSGETSRRLVEKVDRGVVTLLDASPQMVVRARRLFLEVPHVKVALCELPEYDLDHLELRDRPYSTIVIHQSFQDLAQAFDNNLYRLANWCSERLTPDGRMIIAAHNSIVETERPDGFEIWDDPFPHILRGEIRRSRILRPRLRSRPTRPHYTRAQIEDAFLASGFAKVDRTMLRIPMGMDERILMWRVPAVMNSIVDLGSDGTREIPAICDSLRRQLVH
jgi:SAM-dependent methyltransferase